MVHNVARKLISSKVDSILPDDQSLSVLLLQNQEVILLAFKIFRFNCCGLDVHKTLIQRAELITSKLVSLLFPKVWRNCVISLQNTIVLKFVWNLPASIGSLYLIFWKKQIFLLFLLIPNIRNYKKETRLTERMRNEFVIYSCVKWLNLPLFHLLKFAIEFQETSRNNRPL